MMALGSYTFYWNPDRWDEPREAKSSSVLNTYSSVAYFSWGLLLPGKRILLEWNWMLVDQWNQLRAIYEADVPVIWDPENGNLYNVEVMNLDGQLAEVVGIAGQRRENVKVSLVIISSAGLSS
jgi:hypothetical protein